MSSFTDILGPSASRRVKAEAIAGAVMALTGERPVMKDRPGEDGGYTEISLTDSQAEKLRTLIDGWLSKKPGNVRVNLVPVWVPLVMRRFGIWATGLAAASFYIGRKS